MLRLITSILCLSLLFSFITCTPSFEDQSSLSVISLEGDWEFKQAGDGEWLPASVPGCVHTDLLANGKIEDPYYRFNENDLQWIEDEDWTYKKSFKIDPLILEKDVIKLHFDGLDTYADVFLNDSLIISADNMFLAWESDVKKILTPGENTIKVQFYSPVKKGLEKKNKLPYILQATSEQAPEELRTSIFTRKAPFHYGWDWGPRLLTSGIWQPVRIESWNTIDIEDIYFSPKAISEKLAQYNLQIEANTSKELNGQILVEVGSHTFENDVTFKSGENYVELPIDIQSPELWTVAQWGNPYLYDVNIKIIIDENIVAQKQTKLGVRDLKLIQKPDSFGHSFHFQLNGKPLFVKGANYIPTDFFVANQKKEDYEAVLDDALDANMNMLRVWGGAIYEKEQFYQLCNEKGILIWQDFIFACALQPSDDMHLENIRKEANYQVKRLRDNPSIAIWCGNNENLTAWYNWKWKDMYDSVGQETIWGGYQKIFYEILDEAVTGQSDVPYWSSSPQTIDRKVADGTSGDEHDWGIWFAALPHSAYYDHVPRFASEYGMQALPSIESQNKFMEAEDFDYRSPFMEHRQRSKMEWFAPGMNGNEMMKTYMSMTHPVPEKWEQYVYMTQLVQAQGLANGIQAHRTARPHCMGSMFWQINDCWPALSWSSVDYYGEWKASHYSVREAFEDIQLMSRFTDGKVKSHFVSDLFVKKDIKVDRKIIDFKGNVLWEDSEKIQVWSESSNPQKEINISSLVDESKWNAIVLVSEYSYEGKLNRDLTYFVPVKDLLLNSDPSLYIERTENNQLKITSTELAKNVFVEVKGSTGHFDNNFIDVLPGEEIILTFDQEIDLMDFEISSMSVNDVQDNN